MSNEHAFQYQKIQFDIYLIIKQVKKLSIKTYVMVVIRSEGLKVKEIINFSKT